jgi:hypothetical protein
MFISAPGKLLDRCRVDRDGEVAMLDICLRRIHEAFLWSQLDLTSLVSTYD